MATALAQGFIKAGLVTPRDILASDPAEAACEAFAKGTGAKTTNEWVVNSLGVNQGPGGF